MNKLIDVGRFLWDFVVGDDWRIALAVVVALAITAVAAGGSFAVWWIVPLLVAVILAVSVFSVARKR